MCRVLEVSTSGFYDWRERPLSSRALEDRRLTERICEIHEQSRGTYGACRVHAALRREGIHVGKKRVARLMRAASLRDVSRRKGVTTTVSKQAQASANDLVKRDFEVCAPNELWVAEITYVPTATDFLFLYLLVVLDAFSRRVIG